MEDLSSVAIAQVTVITASEGFMALFIVQLMGVVIALGLSLSLHKVHTDPIPIAWRRSIYAAVVVVVVLTIFVAFRQTEFLTLLWGWFKFKGNPPEGVVTVNQALCIYFLTDFAALGFLIYATGGSEHSLFSTFLFVLVPITIALGNEPGWEIVLEFAGITIAIFLVLVWLKPPAYIHNVNAANTPRRLWFAIITSACVIFPTTVYCLRNPGQGTNTMSVASLSGAESNSLSVRDGALDLANAISAVGEHSSE